VSKAADLVFKHLARHFRRLDSTRLKCERLFSGTSLSRRDIEQVYVGLYLDAIVSFERFIETVFIGYLAGTIIPQSSRIAPRVSLRSESTSRDVVQGGNSYVDWFPYRLTEKRAEAFFTKGMPFCGLEKAEKKTIEHLFIIRNVIAHKSAHSTKLFEREVIGSLPLSGRERIPAAYLRGTFRISPVQTRYENLVGEMASIAQKLI
jgi:hypothetical protein